MNVLGIDFEDWFHPELIQKSISVTNTEPKVINGIHKILKTIHSHLLIIIPEKFAQFEHKLAPTSDPQNPNSALRTVPLYTA